MKRRTFLLKSSAGAASVLAFPRLMSGFEKASAGGSAGAIPKVSGVFAESSETLKVAIVGCGRCGLRSSEILLGLNMGVRIVAIADAFADCAQSLRDRLSQKYGRDMFDVPPSRIFIGLDSYLGAVNSDADIVVLATPPVFRPREVAACVAAGKHFLMEKPVCVDPVQARQMRPLARAAKNANLTAVCGLQRRYHMGYREAAARVAGGDIGEITHAQCFWFLPHFDGMDVKACRDDFNFDGLEYQLRNWAMFVWASGDHIVEQQVHNLDVMSWIFGRKPEYVNGLGGRGVDLPMPEFGNRFSHFSVDYDYGGGVHLQASCRQEPGTDYMVLERVFGTKGVLETNMFGETFIRGEKNWIAKRPPEPVVQLHKELVESVRGSLGVNQIDSATDSSMMAVAGRLSAYSGRRFRYSWAELKSRESLMPAKLEFGRLPVAPLAVPGKYKLV